MTSSTSTSGAEAPAVMPTARAPERAPVDLGGALDELGVAAAGAAADLDKPLGIRGIRGADHQEGVDLGGHGLDGFLAVGGGVADVFLVRADDGGKRARRAATTSAVSSTERVVWVM